MTGGVYPILIFCYVQTRDRNRCLRPIRTAPTLMVATPLPRLVLRDRLFPFGSYDSRIWKPILAPTDAPL